MNKGKSQPTLEGGEGFDELAALREAPAEAIGLARRRSSARIEGATRILAALQQTASAQKAPTLEEMLRLVFRTLNDAGSLPGGPNEELLHVCCSNVRREDEGAVSPAQAFLRSRVVVRAARSDCHTFLETIARHYVECTKYLFPLLTAFGHVVARNFAFSGGLYLMLRDSLPFWSTIRTALGGDVASVRLVSYSRLHEQVGAEPSVFIERPDGRIRRCGAPLRLGKDCMTIDAGLYGSIVDVLIRRGYQTKDAAVLFLASRNPNIAGYVTALSSSSILSHHITHPTDLIRVADTVESLFKPFAHVLHQSAGGMTSLRVETADPIAYTCSMALQWALCDYARLGYDTSMTEAKLRALLRRLNDGNERWVCRASMPKWEKGDHFVSAWRHGPLPPMNILCWLSL